MYGMLQLRMYYHMFGPSIGSLNVYTRNSVGGQLKQVWQRTGNVGDYFERIDIQLFEQQAFQVGSQGNSSCYVVILVKRQ